MAPAESVRQHPVSSRKTAAPFFVGLFNPVARRLARAGLMGPNVLLTVAGRKSGLPRTTPVALINVGGRRWLLGVYGPVDWVQNLRAAGRATVTIKGRAEPVQAAELSPSDAARFFREVLTPFIVSLPMGRLLIRSLGGGDILTDPEAAAQRRPVFELSPAASAGGQARAVPKAQR
ncbi:MAG: nitroreductase family deazaflavin-dependent oxidoreductase [Chloroflexi bacterium]|nr:MAG: nitroreductase family deazaflavin-dependent oxidoreductase [Chloroflexota bacterium]TME46979.1 MAG: nitroreductase family deazaflavin-dependent oxidoreductase [Chloroflexota bacterium]